MNKTIFDLIGSKLTKNRLSLYSDVSELEWRRMLKYSEESVASILDLSFGYLAHAKDFSSSDFDILYKYKCFALIINLFSNYGWLALNEKQKCQIIDLCMSFGDLDSASYLADQLIKDPKNKGKEPENYALSRKNVLANLQEKILNLKKMSFFWIVSLVQVVCLKIYRIFLKGLIAKRVCTRFYGL